MKLPEEFCRRMQDLLGEDYPEFLLSYNRPRLYGLRVNTLKISVEKFLKVSPFVLSSIPWTDNGFYFSEQDRPAKHPYYHAGLFYIQEPSAMAPAQVLSPEPGDRVLDLCAAPGGKSTQIICNLQGKGLLVSNDINFDRTKALTKNLELFGAVNAVILNENPEKLAAKFPGFFSKVLIDAPCSGEGMFRKDPDAARQWGIHTREKCVVMQQDILFHAAKMIAPGGHMVYSTCTFNLEENEKMIEAFLHTHPDFFLLDLKKASGWNDGIISGEEGSKELKKAARLWPHKVEGEGHFVALLKKTGDLTLDSQHFLNSYHEPKLKVFFDFVQDNLQTEFKGNLELFGSHLYLQPFGLPDLHGIKVVRPGLYLGMMKKNRFEPSHALSLSLEKKCFRRTLDFSADAKEIINYLKGETLCSAGERGWTAVCVDGYPLGWGKQLDTMLKNHYPKGWRRMD